jgi:GNAT superfamily N-acetyltransferase
MKAESIGLRSNVPSDIEKASQLRNLFSFEGTSRKNVSPTYYGWKLLNNPVRKGQLCVAHFAEQVVGVASITPKRLLIMGKTEIGAEIGDTFTHPNFQRRGIFSRLVNLCLENATQKNIDFIYGTPNKQSLPGYEKNLGFSRIPNANVWRYIRPVNVQNVLFSLPKTRPFAKIIGPILDVLFKTVYAFQGIGSNGKGISVEQVAAFPEGIGRVWEKVSSNYDWILVRDKVYLDWRYFENPDRYRVWIAQREEIPLGYIVVKLGTWRKMRVGYIADFLSDESDMDVFRELLQNAFQYFKNNKVDLIATWAVENSKHQKILKRYGFIRNKRQVIIWFKNEAGRKVMNRTCRWHFTMADSDNI